MKWKPLYLAVCVLLLDQCTKVIVAKMLVLNVEYVAILGDFMGLRYIENSGMALGLFADLPKYVKDVLFNCLTLLAIFMLLRFYYRVQEKEYGIRSAFALILGGAFGNIFDKLFGYIIFHGEWRFLYGRVVDFFDIGIGVHRWPTFNVADIAISVGLLFLFFRSFVTKDYDLFGDKELSSQ